MRRHPPVSKFLIFCVALSFSAAQAQVSASGQQPSSSKDDKVRVYISDSQSWEMSGGWGMAGDAGGFGGGGHASGGARPQTAEIYKTFGERCPELTATNAKEKANYAVLLDHEGGKGALRRRNKVVVFNRAGDAIFSGSTLSLGNSVKDACAAMHKDYDAHKNEPSPSAADPSSPAPSEPAARETATVTVTSNPSGADISVDDAFVGNAPAKLKLNPGKHTVRAALPGYKEWSRELTVLPGSEVQLAATLEKLN